MAEESTPAARIEPRPGRVREISDAVGCGLLAARRLAMREALMAAVDRATSVDDLKPVIRALIDRSGQ